MSFNERVCIYVSSVRNVSIEYEFVISSILQNCHWHLPDS